MPTVNIDVGQLTLDSQTLVKVLAQMEQMGTTSYSEYLEQLVDNQTMEGSATHFMAVVAAAYEHNLVHIVSQILLAMTDIEGVEAADLLSVVKKHYPPHLLHKLIGAVERLV